MSNDSASGGYLAPDLAAAPDVAEDAALDAVLHAFVVGCTGLAGALVRPRWQAVPPPQPPVDATWCAVGVVSVDPDVNASIMHESAGDGQDRLWRHEALSAQASFYGPLASRYGALLRDGAYVAQNREALFLAGAALIDMGTMTSAPELINQQWVRRVDVDFRIRRRVERVYPVRNVLRAQGGIINDAPGASPEPFKVEP